jgi:fructose-1,6-bisphosphatase/sedoheptulose 1,7-bisphosphatase-like protein
MKFNLIQKTATKFQVVNSGGDIVGSISVANEQEAADLVRQFGGAAQPHAVSKSKSAVQMLAESFKARKLGEKRQSYVLRGC